MINIPDALISSANVLAVFVRERWHWLRVLRAVIGEVARGHEYERLMEEQLSAINTQYCIAKLPDPFLCGVAQ